MDPLGIKYTLPETNGKRPLVNAWDWKTIVTFLGPGLFSGAFAVFLVLGREYHYLGVGVKLKKKRI